MVFTRAYLILGQTFTPVNAIESYLSSWSWKGVQYESCGAVVSATNSIGGVLVGTPEQETQALFHSTGLI